MLKKLALVLIFAVLVIPTITKAELDPKTNWTILLEMWFCENWLESLDATIVKMVTPWVDFVSKTGANLHVIFFRLLKCFHIFH